MKYNNEITKTFGVSILQMILKTLFVFIYLLEWNKIVRACGCNTEELWHMHV